MYCSSSLSKARYSHVQRWKNSNLTTTSSFASLREIMADLAAQAAAKKASSPPPSSATVPAGAPPGFAKPFGSQPQGFGNNRAAPGAPVANWSHSFVKAPPQKFNVDVNPTNTKFETTVSPAGASIRETMQKLSDAAKAKAYKEPGNAQANSPFGGARPLRTDTFSSLRSLNRPAGNANNNSFARPEGGGPPTGGYPPAGQGPTTDRRFNQQVQRIEHKREEFQVRLSGAEQYPRKDRAMPNNFNKHRNNDKIEIDRDVVASMVARNGSGAPKEENLGPSSFYNKDTGHVEINVAAMKAEMLRKKEYADAEQAYIETAKKARATVVLEVVLPGEGLTIRELASKLSMRTKELTKKLEEMGVISAHSEKAEDSEEIVIKGDDRIVDADSAELLVLEMGFNVKRLENKTAARAAAISERPSHVIDENVVMVPRAPVVCVMGHVDHGKTTLLDTLRKFNLKNNSPASTKTPAPAKKAAKGKSKAGKDSAELEEVAGTEAGGITQKLSAFSVDLSEGRKVMFLDTPGHAAFSSMRSHGAVATDLVILVVAIDDGVRPQTLEALQMAKQANCSIIVVLNKVDKIPYDDRPAARNRVLTQLLNNDLIAEDFGGEVQVVEVAGRTGEGISTLMEGLLLQAEVLELQAAISGQAEAVVLDANMEKGKGVIADILVRWGALNVGDPIVVGGSYGKVKSMVNDKGESVRTALPSNAVRLLGLRTLPSSGQEMLSVESETVAKEIADRRVAEVEARRNRDETLAMRRAEAKARADAALSVGDLAGAAAAKASVEKIKINVVIKADGVGTLEALKQIVQGIASRAVSDIEIAVVGSSVGDVSTTDVELAATGGDALILAFNVGIVDSEARSMAKVKDVNICRDNVIYRLEDELVRTMLSHLPKERSLQREGLAKVQKVFNISGSKSAVVAGLIVQNGRLRNKATHGNEKGETKSAGDEKGGFVFRVIRKGVVIADEKPSVDLKRLKNVVHEVESGMECGLAMEGFNDFQEDDEIECLKIVWTAPTEAVLPGVSGTIKSDRGAKGSATADSDSKDAKTGKKKA